MSEILDEGGNSIDDELGAAIEDEEGFVAGSATAFMINIGRPGISIDDDIKLGG